MGVMRGAMLQAPGKFTVVTMPIPVPGDDELLVRTKACGICTSELDIWEGRLEGLEYPRFIGHEPSGIVEAVGKDVKEFSPGDHVSVWSEGKAYAEFFTAPAAHAAKLSPGISLEQALGEPIACSTNGVLKADPQRNDSVCIIGCGFMGLIMLQVFKARGAGLCVAVDTRETILALAKKLGATYTLNPKTTDVAAAVKDLTGGRGVDIGVEAAGKQTTLDMAASVVRMEGKLVVFGFHTGPPRLVPWGFWNWMAFSIINGHVRSAHVYVHGMKTGLALLESGALNMEPLVTHRFSLEEINKGFEVASAKQEGFVKGIIAF